MKKNLKPQIKTAIRPVEPNIEIFMTKIEQHLIHLARKIDVLIVQNSVKPSAPKDPANASSQSGNRPDRVMYKATCADCSSQCEVPFRPTGDRPVYCKECFAKRKSGGPRANLDQKLAADFQKAGGKLNTPQIKALFGKNKKFKEIKKTKKAKKAKK